MQIHQKSLVKIEKSLFHDPDGKVNLSEKEEEIKLRLKDIFTQRLEKPWRKDIQLIRYMEKEYDLSRGAAFNYVQTSKILFGTANESSEAWNEYMVINMLQEAFKMAKKAGKPKEMIYAADKIGKYTKLDQVQGEKIPWNEIVPQSFEPTGDIEVLGLSPIDNLREKQRKMREKYASIEDAVIIP